MSRISSLKNKLDEIFSRYIRLRDCLATTGTPVRGRCITCGVVKDYQDLEAGHFQSRRYGATRFDIRNVNIQCESCNRFHSGRQEIYAKAIDRKYGLGTVERLEIKGRQHFQFRSYELEEQIRYYRKRIKELIEK